MTQPLRESRGRRPLWAAAFAVLLGVYASTLARTVTGGDAGELATAVCAGGVAHPPGYPLYVLLGRLFLFLPLGSPAARLAFLSAVCGAAAATLLLRFLLRQGVPSAAALLGTAFYAFADQVWHYAVTPEVFALHALLVVLLLTVAGEGTGSAGARWPLLFGVLTGLGLAHHQTILFVAAPLAPLLLAGEGGARGATRRLLLAGAGLLLGLLPYLYLPMAAGASHSWGDPSTLEGFLTHVLRREYGSFRLVGLAGGADVAGNLQAFGATLLRETWWVGALLAAVGLVAALGRSEPPRRRALWVALAASLALSVGLFHALANVDLALGTHRQVLLRFWIVPQLLVAAFLARGAAAGMRLFRRVSPRVWTTLAVLVAGALAATRYVRNDVSHDDTIDRYARSTLAALPPDAALLLRGDLGYPVVYLQACEGQRPDVALVDRFALGTPWGRAAALRRGLAVPPGLYALNDPPGAGEGRYGLAELLEANVDRRPVYLGSFRADLLEYQQTETWAGRFDVLPWGVLMRAERHQPVRDWDRYLQESRLALTHETDGAPLDAWDQLAATELVDSAYLRGAYLALAAQTTPAVAPLALQALDEAAAWPGQPEGRVWKARGYAYAAQATADPRKWEEAAAAWRRYLATAPAGDEGRAEVERAVAEVDRHR